MKVLRIILIVLLFLPSILLSTITGMVLLVNIFIVSLVLKKQVIKGSGRNSLKELYLDIIRRYNLIL